MNGQESSGNADLRNRNRKTQSRSCDAATRALADKAQRGRHRRQQHHPPWRDPCPRRTCRHREPPSDLETRQRNGFGPKTSSRQWARSKRNWSSEPVAVAVWIQQNVVASLVTRRRADSAAVRITIPECRRSCRKISPHASRKGVSSREPRQETWLHRNRERSSLIRSATCKKSSTVAPGSIVPRSRWQASQNAVAGEPM